MKIRHIALVFAALTSLPFLGCSAADSGPGQSDPAGQAEVEDLGGKADATSKPVGTYELSKPATMGSHDFIRLVLKTDKTFHSEQQVMCVTYPCNPIGTDGTYKLTKSTITGKKYLRLTVDGETTRYEYKLASGGVLKLRADGATAWSEMTKAQDGWCSVEDDCSVQNLPQPKCPGHWQCESNTCSYSECSPIPNECEAAGGSCVALYPGSCADGVVGDANTYSCGGGLGVECCLPKTTNPCEAAGGSCVALYPGSCPNGQIGDANTYSCGGGLGVECCLPTP